MKRIRVIAVGLAVCSLIWPAYKIYDGAVIYPRQVDKCWNGNRSIESRRAICTRLVERTGLSQGKRRRDLRGRAWFYLRRDEFDAALGDAQSMLDIKSDDPWAWVVRGEVFAKQENWDAAFGAFAQAITLERDKTNPLGRRARAYARKGDYDFAMQDYDAVLELEPKNYNALKQRVRMFALQGDYDGALQAAEDAAKVLPEKSWFNEARGRLYALHLKDDARALELFEQELPQSFYPLVMHFRMGNDAQGEKIVRDAGQESGQSMREGMNIVQRAIAKVNFDNAIKHANLLLEAHLYYEIGEHGLTRARVDEFIEQGGSGARHMVWSVMMKQEGKPASGAVFDAQWDTFIQSNDFDFSLDWFE